MKTIILLISAFLMVFLVSNTNANPNYFQKYPPGISIEHQTQPDFLQNFVAEQSQPDFLAENVTQKNTLVQYRIIEKSPHYWTHKHNTGNQFGYKINLFANKPFNSGIQVRLPFIHRLSHSLTCR